MYVETKRNVRTLSLYRSSFPDESYLMLPKIGKILDLGAGFYMIAGT